jgi:Flp pilus assembly pilin Flp
MEDQGQEETPHRYRERKPGVSGVELGLMAVLLTLVLILVILMILLIR